MDMTNRLKTDPPLDEFLKDVPEEDKDLAASLLEVILLAKALRDNLNNAKDSCIELDGVLEKEELKC